MENKPVAFVLGDGDLPMDEAAHLRFAALWEKYGDFA